MTLLSRGWLLPILNRSGGAFASATGRCSARERSAASATSERGARFLQRASAFAAVRTLVDEGRELGAVGRLEAVQEVS